MARFIRLPELLRTIPLSRSTIYAGVKDGTFPAPYKIGERATAWLESDVNAWIESKSPSSVKMEG